MAITYCFMKSTKYAKTNSDGENVIMSTSPDLLEAVEINSTHLIPESFPKKHEIVLRTLYTPS